MDAQSTLSLDPALSQKLESEEVYRIAREGYGNVSNPPDLRLQYSELGLGKAKEDVNHSKAADFAAKCAVVYMEIGLYQKGLLFSLESLEHAKKTPGTYDDIWSLYRLADSHSFLLNHTQAIKEGKQALNLAIERDTLDEIGWAYNQLGEIFRRTTEYDSAIYYYQLTLETFEEAKHPRGIQFSHQNMGLAYASMGELDKASNEFDKASAISVDTDILYQMEQGEASLKIIRARYGLDSAIQFGDQMIELAEIGKFPRWVRQYKATQAEYYRENSEWEKAWQYHHEADSMEELQTGERIRIQSNITDHQYRMQLLQAEHDLDSQQNQNKVLLWISVLLVLGLLAMVAMIQITKNQRIRKINQRLSQQNESLDELIDEKDIWINLMAHDLKAPLNAISGLVEMLRNDELPPQIREKALGNISRSVNKGSTLITQLLEISRLESEDVKVNIQDTNLVELIAETEKIFAAAAENKAITLVNHTPSEPVMAKTDPIHAQRILENIVSNALKFSPKGKQVELVVEDMGVYVVIHVKDEGPGMSDEDQQNLFQKFKRLTAQPTGGESSTGLGLSIVKQLADRIDVDILVKSEKGQGSTFSLQFPT